MWLVEADWIQFNKTGDDPQSLGLDYCWRNYSRHQITASILDENNFKKLENPNKWCLVIEPMKM